MSIMVDWEIREAIDAGKIMISPLDDSLINPSSIDIRLGDHVSILKCDKGNVIDPKDPSSFSYVKIELPYNLPPNAFVIAPMLENVKLANNIAVELKGKSSIARLGLANSDAAGWVDNGWDGILTMELFNHTKDLYIKLTEGMKIGQLIFYKTSHAKDGYHKKGRYHNQAAGQGSKGV